ncbi:undecaprenyl-phosphate glucose phosphotransferase [Williamsia maris]
MAAPTPSPRRRLYERLRTDPLHTVVTVALDAVAAVVAVAVAVIWAHLAGVEDVATWLPWLFVPLVIVILASRSMYRRSLRRNFLDELGPLQTTVALAALLTLLAMLLFGDQPRPGAALVRIWLCAAVLMPAARLGRAMVQRYLRKRYKSAAATLIIGNGRIAHQLMSRMAELPEYGLRPVGIIDVAPPRFEIVGADDAGFDDVPYLGRPEDLAEIATAAGAEELIVSFSEMSEDSLTATVRVAHDLGMRVWVVPRVFDAVGARARIEHLGGVPLLVLPQVNPRGWQFTVKHGMDRGLTGLGLLVISPIFLTLALLVKLSSPGPIFFKQQRVGRDGQVFDCLKFRSMRPPKASDAQFELKEGAAPGGVEGVDRRTRIGKLMRATSLDELPQLLNVLRGDMSLVGPRPERPEFVALFDMQIRRYGERHRVKAGVTGWAQVHGLRGQTSIADRAEWDNYYIENWSLLLDIKILALTALTVLHRAE